MLFQKLRISLRPVSFCASRTADSTASEPEEVRWMAANRAVCCFIEQRKKLLLGWKARIFGCGDGMKRIGERPDERFVFLPEHDAHLVEVHKLAAICSKI